MTEPASYSIAVRVRRVTAEEGYVRVPVDASVMNPEPEADGTYRLDGEKVMVRALQLAAEPTEWRLEEQSLSIHPSQKAPDGVVDPAGTDSGP